MDVRLQLKVKSGEAFDVPTDFIKVRQVQRIRSNGEFADIEFKQKGRKLKVYHGDKGDKVKILLTYKAEAEKTVEEEKEPVEEVLAWPFIPTVGFTSESKPDPIAQAFANVNVASRPQQQTVDRTSSKA